ncbi:MAG: hypothetical protein ACOCXH_03110 [Cyclobacteriaceae bacterium]
MAPSKNAIHQLYIDLLEKNQQSNATNLILLFAEVFETDNFSLPTSRTPSPV